MTTPPFSDLPARVVASADGTPIAVFSVESSIASRGRPLLLVHGTAGDHRTWRAVGPLLAARRPVLTMDRRGRGASGDGSHYAVELELEDVVVVAEALLAACGSAVDVAGHSLGGRIALGASLLTPAIRSVTLYEGAPVAPDPALDALASRLRTLLNAGDLDGLLATFMADAVGMPDDELAAFRASALWQERAATGQTIVRELEAARSAHAIGLDAIGRAAVPVLQLVGSASPAWFREGAAALDARLADGRLLVIEGARHAAHHSHPEAFAARVETFLDA